MDHPGPEPRPNLAPHPTLTQYYGEDARRPRFVQDLFDHTAPSYDRFEAMVGLGTGPWYRREALRRAGIQPGMRVLDVAIGTGLVAREAMRLVEGTGCVIGLDPSPGMLLQARRALHVAGVRAYGEIQPMRDASFDAVTMGYGLRHLSDLGVTFGEFFRVLKPGGRVCILELTPPPGRLGRTLLRIYLKGLVPPMAWIVSGSRDGRVLMSYFWDTVHACVPPAKILEAMHGVGFVHARRSLAIGLFSEYTAFRPGPGVPEPTPDDLKTGGNFMVRVFPLFQPEETVGAKPA